MLNFSKWIIEKELVKFYYQSFYLGNELVEKFNEIHLKFDESWVALALCDGIVGISKSENEPIKSNTEDFSDEFKYPISEFIFPSDTKSDFFIDTKVANISVFKYLDWEIGLKFSFENDHFMVIYEELDETTRIDFDFLPSRLVGTEIREEKISGA